tara:strand:+ start:789 stop:1661 length:873 start_codon:yes stop_codon:yes gene_type:complete
MTDALSLLESQQIDVSNGFVRIVDVMPRIIDSDELRCDSAIVQSARVSYAEGTKVYSSDAALIHYLMRNWHTSPFEMIEFKFHLKMPIFVARQWIRHRTASLNEISGRYSIVRDEFYKPDEVRMQSTSNRQGSDGAVESESDTHAHFMQYLEKSEALYKEYESALNGGVARELARIALPASLMTEFYWKIDLHNLFHFLRLRMDHHAQKEIRDLATAVFDIIKQLCPVSSNAFLQYRVNSMQLSSLEVDAIKNQTDKLESKNKREQTEFNDKLKELNLNLSASIDSDITT